MSSACTRKRGSAANGLADLPEIGGRIEALGRVDLRQSQGKVLAQLLGQRQVGQDLLLGEPEAEALERARPLEAHRHQDQGRMARLLGGRRLVPFEEAERQVEDADAALLIVGAGVVIEPEQPALQTLGAEPGLQPEVPVLRQGRLGGRAGRRQCPRTDRRSAARHRHAGRRGSARDGRGTPGPCRPRPGGGTGSRCARPRSRACSRGPRGGAR